MPMRNVELMQTLTQSIGTEPVQSSGSYRAWQLAGTEPSAFDLAWHSRAGHSVVERQDLLPFTEPSLAIRRRFSPTGETLEWDFVVFRAQPDGGHYDTVAGEELFALRFAPEVMEIALGLRAAEFLHEDCEVPTALRKQLDGVRRLADLGRFQAAWIEMHNALRMTTRDIEIDRVAQAARLARQTKGRLSPADIAEEAGLSLRHMRRCFVERLGLSPRAILRRQRLTAVMLDAERSARPRWAELAAQHNFSDQAHMIRECRALTGQSPTEWHRARRRLAVSFNT